MSKLKRFDLSVGGFGGAKIIQWHNGEYVKFDDIKELLNSSHNKPMPKLPTLEECQAHVQRELCGFHMSASSVSIIERVYDFICRQLSA